MAKTNYDGKHLTTTHHIKIEKGLLDGESLASIARKITKHPSTVAKEIKKYRYFPERECSAKKLPCLFKKAVSFVFSVTKRTVLNSARPVMIPRVRLIVMKSAPITQLPSALKSSKHLMSVMLALRLNAVRFSMPSIPLSRQMKQPRIFWFPAAAELTSLRPTSPCSMTSFHLY
ncbi:hypothetical protein SPX_24420 [Sporomusa paucivorans]